MFYRKVNEQTELRLIERQHGDELFKLIDSNREYWRQWHPWLPDRQCKLLCVNSFRVAEEDVPPIK